MPYYTTDQVDLNEIYYKTIVPSITRYNQYDFYPFREALCSDGDESYIKYPISQITFGALGEAETPNASRLKYARFRGTTAKKGAGFGYTFDFLKDANKQMIDDTQAAIYDADRQLQQNTILNAALDGDSAAGFWNTAYDTESNVTAYDPLNAPPNYGQNTFSTMHTHYEGLGTATAALSQITNAKQHIAEHGHGGPYTMWINSAEVEKFENLTAWTTATISANPVNDKVALDGWTGVHTLGVDFYSTEAIPAGYMLMVSMGRGANYDKPIKLIQPSNASYRGLILKPGNTDRDYPIIDSYFLRWLGAKVWARGAGYTQILTAAATTYTTPTLIG